MLAIADYALEAMGWFRFGFKFAFCLRDVQMRVTSLILQLTNYIWAIGVISED